MGKFRHTLSVLACIGLFAPAMQARAQSLSQDIAAFFNEAPAPSLHLRGEVDPTAIEALALREAMDAAAMVGEPSLLRERTAGASSELRTTHPALVELGSVLLSAFDEDSLDRETLISALSEFEAGNDWYAGVYADSILAALHLRQSQVLLASQYTQSALERIPESTSQLANDAQLILADRMTMLYGASADPVKMLAASEASRAAHQRLGLDFNRHELMTNFLFAFNRNRDHASATAMAELLAAETMPDEAVLGLSEAYSAALLNEIGNYAGAHALIEATRFTDDPLVQRRARYEGMIALAGLGRRADAMTEMQSLGLVDEDGAFTARADRSEGALHARALLAVNAGDAREAVALQNRRLDVMVGKLYAANAEDTAALLSHLENSRARQTERRVALERLAEARAVQLAQKTRINALLLTLLLAVAAAFVALFLFTRYRHRNNLHRHAMQEQSLSAERMKTEFLGMINHEMRTPLNGVIGMSDALIHHSPDAQTRRQAQVIQDSGQTLLDLIESLIDMSTLEAGRFALAPSETALEPELRSEAASWQDAAQQKSLLYTQYFGPHLDEVVTADAVRVRQCVRILLSNATRFTQSGRIHLHATAHPEGGALAVKVIVADTGRGMSEHVQSRLFKPFLQADGAMTRKFGGAGLNLAIARKLARMMDGELSVVSSEGRGSEFTLTLRLPLAVGQTTRTAPETAPKAVTETGLETVTEAASEGSVPENTAVSSGSAPRIAPDTAEALDDDPQVADPDDATVDLGNALDAAIDALEAVDRHSGTTDAYIPSADDASGTGPDRAVVSATDRVVDLMVQPPDTPAGRLFGSASSSPTRPAAAPSPTPLEGRTVLIVDDLQSNLDVLRLMIEPEGCACITASSGKDALAVLAARRVDVVVMDICMPDMDGVETTARIRASSGPNHAVPIIALTADAGAQTRLDARAAGAEQFLTKPVLSRDLLSAMRTLLADASTALDRTA